MRKKESKQKDSLILRYRFSQDEKEANPIVAENIIAAIKEGKEVEIINAVIEGDFTFNSVTAEAKISIENTTIKGHFACSYVTFKKILRLRNLIFEKHATFRSIKVEQEIFLDGTVFKKKVDLSNITVTGNFLSTSAEFKGKANFNSAKIEGTAFFKQAIFAGETNFGSSQIGSTAEFTKAEFKGKADFNSAKIEGTAFFNQAIFAGETDFVASQIGSAAEFTKAEFKRYATFYSCRIKGNVFYQEAKFEGEVCLENIQVDRDLNLSGAVFKKDINLKDSHFETVIYGPKETQFYGGIDLRGSSYKRIEPIPFWKKLTKKLKPYDRQPFTQLEKIFREAGKDHLANNVYYERRLQEATQISKWNLPALAMDWFLRWLTGYGVKLSRLLLFIIPILIVGSIIFQLPGAVEKSKNSGEPSGVQAQRMKIEELSLSIQDSFLVSLNFFLPVKLPLEEEWKPSASKLFWVLRYKDIAILLTLAGWIFVPVGIAGLSGILKR